MKENCYNLLKESMAKEKTDAGISTIKEALDTVTKQSREQCESLSKQLVITLIRKSQTLSVS
jgi:transposase